MALNRTSRRIALRLTLVLFVTVLAGFVLWRTLPEAGLKRQVTALQNAGLPTSSSEVNEWYPTVPDEENAALLISAAAQEHVSPGNSVSMAALPLAASELTPELAEEIAAHLGKNEAVLARLHAAARLSRSRYPVDFSNGPETLLPHLAKIKGLAQLLRYEAAYECAQRNRERAVASVDAGFALAHTLRDEPTLIAQLVRIACVAIALDSLDKLVSAFALEDMQLQVLSSRLAEADADGLTGIYRAIVGERAGAIEFMSTGRPYYWELAGVNTNRGAIFQKATSGLHAALGLRERDLAIYLESAGRFLDVITNGFPGAFQRSEEVKAQMEERVASGLGRFVILSRAVVPAWNKAIARLSALSTQVRCAQVALAVERYRLAHTGELPEGLDELAPEFIAELPLDPVQGEPFTFTLRSEGGYRISSPVARNVLKNPRQTQFGVNR